MGLNPDILNALDVLNVHEPTEIQTMSLPAIMKGGNYLLASHTGSGKTLGYLLPIIQMLKEEEGEGFVPRPKRPRALILGPTKELTEQITGVAKALCHKAKFRALCLNSNRKVAEQKNALAGPMDVVIATPTRFLQHVAEGHVFFRDIRWLVIDEADTMFAQGWGEEVQRILEPLSSKPIPAQVVLVSATMTKAVKKLCTANIKDVMTLQTSTMHKAVAGSRHQFMTMPPGGDKLQQLGQILDIDSKRQRKALVFCNTMDSCRAVEHYCRDASIASVCYHGEMPIEARKASMATFAAAQPGSSDEDSLLPIMIATDLAARGLDFPGQVDHVINFDFPTNPVDYIHRTGRTARAGNTGKITSLVTKRDRVLAQRVQWALEHDEPLDQLTNDKDELPPSQLRLAADQAARRNAPVPGFRENRFSRRGGKNGGPDSRGTRRGGLRVGGGARGGLSSRGGTRGGRGGRGGYSSSSGSGRSGRSGASEEANGASSSASGGEDRSSSRESGGASRGAYRGGSSRGGGAVRGRGVGVVAAAEGGTGVVGRAAAAVAVVGGRRRGGTAAAAGMHRKGVVVVVVVTRNGVEAARGGPAGVGAAEEGAVAEGGSS
ncbi:MAG: hypothetical protein WDW36_005665 [Sanguina aurantia]